MIITKQIFTLEDCPAIAVLFDEYRVFYQQPSDVEGAKKFISNRLSNKESIVLVAYQDDEAVGFTQLYPSFSSVSMKPLYILNDLYVVEAMRGYGAGAALLHAAEQMGQSLHWKGMVLETAHDNPAQKLYERLGWSEDKDYKHYGKYF